MRVDIRGRERMEVKKHRMHDNNSEHGTSVLLNWGDDSMEDRGSSLCLFHRKLVYPDSRPPSERRRLTRFTT